MGNSCCRQQEDCGPQNGLNGGNGDSEPLAPVELPPGWKAVPSRSRPGKVAYQNIHTGERISWVPTEEAKHYKGGISKKKKKRPPTKMGEDTDGSVSLVDNTSAGQEDTKTSTSAASTGDVEVAAT